MKQFKFSLIALLSLLLVASCNEERKSETNLKPDKMMIRISEIEIDPAYLKEYIAILKEESAASGNANYRMIQLQF